jgi:hypothetical protein
MPGLALLLLHSLLVAVIASQRYEGSWGGFLIYIIDLPVSLLYLHLVKSTSQQVIASIVLGGIWWYVVGSVLARGVCWAWHTLQKHAVVRSQSK